MIDSVGLIVFPTSLFGCSDPVISNGTRPCLIHTGPVEWGSIQEAGFTGDSHSTFLPQIFYQDGTQSQDLCSSDCTSNMRDMPSPVPTPLLTSNFRSLYQQLNNFSWLFSAAFSNYILNVNPCLTCKWHSVNNSYFEGFIFTMLLFGGISWVPPKVASEKPSQRCSLCSLIRLSRSCCQHHHCGLQSTG